MTSTARHSATRRAAQALAATGLLVVAGSGTAMAQGQGDGPAAQAASENAQPRGNAYGINGLPEGRGQAAENASETGIENSSENSSLADAEESDAEVEVEDAESEDTVDAEATTEDDSDTTDTSTTDTADGTYPSVWDAVAECESGGDWDIDTGNGFYGGLQFTYETWQAFGGGEYAETADQATTEQQVEIAQKVLQAQGPDAWPVCSEEAGLTVENGS